MGASLKRVIKNNLDEVAQLAEVVEEFAAEQNLSPRVVYILQLALEEVITNTVKYGYDDDDLHEISVEMQTQDGVVDVTIADDGRHFDPLEAPKADLDSPLQERKIGGVGLHLTVELVDSLDYQRVGEGNVLKLRISG